MTPELRPVDGCESSKACRSRVVAAGMLAMAAFLALMVGTSYAAYSHTVVEKTIPTGADCNGFFSERALHVAVWEASEPQNNLIYVSCTRSGNSPIVKRFHMDGTPAPFSASKPYISGNTITGTPNSPELSFGGSMAIAVDNSSARNGTFAVAGGCPGCQSEAEGQGVQLFTPTGEFAYEFPTKVREMRAEDVDIGPDGSIYVINAEDISPGDGRVRKYDSSTLTEVRRLYNNHLISYVRTLPNGEVWTGYLVTKGSGSPELVKWEQSKFGTNLTTHRGTVNGVSEAVFSPLVSPSGFLLDSTLEGEVTIKNPAAIDVDRSNGDLYIDKGNSIVPYSSGDAEEPPHQDGPVFGTGALSESHGVDVTNDGRVYATSTEAGEGMIVIFAPGKVLPNIRTPEAQIDDVGHDKATLRAHIDRVGGSPITECKLEYGTSKAYSEGSAPCSPDPNSSPPGSYFTNATQDVSAMPTGLSTGVTYHYRFVAANEDGVNLGGDRTFVPAFVLNVHTEGATEIETHSATLTGSFDPDNIDNTEYSFEYGGDKDYGQSTSKVPVPSTAGKKEVSTPISGLPSGKVIHYRIVVQNENGVTKGLDDSFRVASSPEVSGLRATDITSVSATLNARIDPVGYATKYRFEYGPTPEYGSVIPAFDEDIGSGNGALPVSQEIKDLQEGITYHFRVVANNKWGAFATPDTTFDFAPPSCPNAHARQQTGSNYLPDCRAYELVSPGEAGSVLLFPGRESELLGETLFGARPRRVLWSVNRGLASSPPRFAYFGALGAVNGTDPTNSALDMYLAKRTATGWESYVPGVTGHEATAHGELECSDSLALCVDHRVTDGFSSEAGEYAPYLFQEGKRLGQLPSNVDLVSGGKTFIGDQRPSYDFSHFVFSSRTAVFAPGGLSTSPGSAYDNDLTTEAVSLISLTPGGAPIPADVAGTQAIEFPGISTNGSHVLMQVQGAGGGFHLYMRVNDAITYDVSRGKSVTFAGMTRDGSKVYFASNETLTADDTDASTDMYMWSAVGDTLIRISTGNAEDNRDDCSASWTEKCDVKVLTPERLHPWETLSAPGLDDTVASSSGDVYFYSPSSLDPNSPGLNGQRNLYVYRNGVVQLVTTFDPGTEVNRMQISPDGAHAAFVTAAKLTGADTQGFKQMYMYDATTGSINCASCRVDGFPPSADVEASQSGRFMTDDGRAFFATKDELVPQDVDGIIDVYEFVAGRPQLISAGTGSRDFTGGGLSSALTPGVRTGLEGVSADGTDVYFSTYDTLVPQDHNGAFIKIYDARTGGGFDFQYQLAPCEAADECHGAGSQLVTPPIIATEGNLRATGNAKVKKRVSPKKKHRKSRKRGHKRRGHGGGRNHG